MRLQGSFIPRHKDLLRFLAGLLGSCIFALATVLVGRKIYEDKRNCFAGDSLRCVLDFGQYQIRDDVLWAGLSYEMLQDFSSENRCSLSVESYTKRQSSLDSLRRGSVDIVLLPRFDSVRHVTHVDSVLKSRPVCKEVCWVMRKGDKTRMRQLNRWISDYTSRDSFPSLVERFQAMHSSARPPKIFREQQRLSPYDDIIRFYADSIGWDWRMLAAVIYTESKFAINVTSNVGAKGLMQLMPLTAKVYGVQDVLDPKENIRAGASYLGRLDRLFRKYTSPDDRLKYVFASYNVGETRVLRRLNSPSEAPDSALPVTEIDSAAVSEARSGIDSAVTSYIDKIFDNYRNFCRICGE